MKQLMIFAVCAMALLLSVGYSSKKDSHTIISNKAGNVTGKEYFLTKDSLIAELATMKSNKLDCSAKAYWEIVKRGKASIPLLIESLTDTTMTNIYDPCKKANLNIAEVCDCALKEIAEFPAYVVTHIQFDVIDVYGCWSFYDYLYKNKNKPEYQMNVREFYNTHQYTFETFNKTELNDCYKTYKITGKYKLKN